MDTSRVGPGEWIAALGGLLLLIALFFLDWYSIEPSIAPVEIGASFLAQVEPPTEIPGIEIPDIEAKLGAWDEQGFLGTIANLIMLAAAVWAIVAVAIRSGMADLDTGMEPGRLTALAGIVAAVMVVLRIIFPVDEVGGVEFDSGLEFGIFVALVGAVLIALGGMMSGGRATAPPPRARAGEAPPPPPPSQPPPPPSSQPPPGS
jgi:hypothetical protein